MHVLRRNSPDSETKECNIQQGTHSFAYWVQDCDIMSWAEIVCLTLFFRHLWETDRSVLKSKKCPGNKTVCNESPKMSRQKSERNGKSAVAWGSTRVSMINLVDLAGSEKVLRQVYGSHTKLDPALCFALPQPWIKHIKWQSVITHEFEDAIRDSQWCFLCIPSNFLRWNRLGLKENVWRKALWSTNLCPSVFISRLGRFKPITLSGDFGYNKEYLG